MKKLLIAALLLLSPALGQASPGTDTIQLYDNASRRAITATTGSGGKVSQDVNVTGSALPAGGATEQGLDDILAELGSFHSDLSTRIGVTGETAPTSDTTPGGLNSRLQRVNQNLTDQNARIGATTETPAPTDSATSGLNGLAKRQLQQITVLLAQTDELEQRIGALTETAPTGDTLPSGLNGRLQRLAVGQSTLLAETQSFHAGNTSDNLDAILEALSLHSDLNSRLGATAEVAPTGDTLPVGLNGRLQRVAQNQTSNGAILAQIRDNADSVESSLAALNAVLGTTASTGAASDIATDTAMAFLKRITQKLSAEIGELTAFHSDTTAQNATLTTAVTGGNAILTQIRDNADSVEGNTAAAVTGISGVNSNLVTVQGKLDTVNSNLVVVQGKQDTAITAITGVQSRLDILNAKDFATSAKQDLMLVAAGTGNGLLTTIRDNADQVEGYLDGIEGLLGTGNTNTATAVTGINAVNSNLVTVQGKQDTGNTSLATAVTGINSLNAVVGVTGDAAAVADTSTATLISLFKRQLQRISTFITTQTDGTQRAKITNGTNDVTVTAVSGTGSTALPLDVHDISTARGRYFTAFATQQTAATAANASIFTMRNSAASSRTVWIERVSCHQGFNVGNPVTRTQQQYVFQRFSAATPTGGTALTAGLGDSTDAASQVTDIRFLDTGLTTAGVTFVANNLAIMSCDTHQGVTCDRDILGPPMSWRLGPGEGIAGRIGNTAVVGTPISCNIQWREQ